MFDGDWTTKLCLYPEPRALAIEEDIYQNLQVPASTSPSLPYVLVNMVSSVDGRSSVGGKAAGIGSRADRGAMRALRAHVDAVMVGAGTLRAEKLNLGLDDPDVRQPIPVIVGGAGNLPTRERLSGGHRAVILAVPQGALDTSEAGWDLPTVIEVPSTGHGRVDLGWLLRHLKSEHAVDRLLVEGGPALNRTLIDGGLVNELFLTLAPKLLLGKEAAIVSDGASLTQGRPHGLELRSVHSSGSELFLRYRLKSH